jgi:hypothetical protein
MPHVAATPGSADMISVRISQAIDTDLANRLPEHLPLQKINVGVCHLTCDEARALLADAEYNSDLECVDVGPYAMPLATFNAYRALARQLRRQLTS